MTRSKVSVKNMASCLNRLVQIRMNRQTLYQESLVVMANVAKEDCLSIVQAAKEIKSSKATLYNYMNILGIQRYKFPFDRHTYVAKSDVNRIKQFIEEHR